MVVPNVTVATQHINTYPPTGLLWNGVQGSTCESQARFELRLTKREVLVLGDNYSSPARGNFR